VDEIHRKLTKTAVSHQKKAILFDNDRPHVAEPALQKLNELGYESYEPLPHPPYSSAFSPTDYYFFKHLEIL
ncbi:hypothetical protein Angca_003306, partial [Angiostrongylus cantonensis]